MSSKARIFVDEAGNPGLPNPKVKNFRPYFVFGYVYSHDPSKLTKRLRRLLKKLHHRNKYPAELAELKFYLPYSDLITKYGYTAKRLDDEYSVNMPEIRSKTLSIINDFSDGVFAAIVDKRLVAKSLTSESLQNFVFAQTLFVNILNAIRAPVPPQIIYDKGRLSPTRAHHFHAYVQRKEEYFQQRQIKQYPGSILPPKDATSVSEAGIWAADMVAGSFYHKYAHRDHAYSNMTNSKRIGDGERFFWESGRPHGNPNRA